MPTTTTATAKNNRWFGMDLSYDWGLPPNSLNGQYCRQQVRSKANGKQRAYGFGYDEPTAALCRL